MPRLVRLGLLLLVSLLLSGCVTLKDPEASQEYTGDVVARLKPGQSVGQIFISRRSGFNGVQLWLRQTAAPENENAVLLARLYRGAEGGEPAATTQVRFAEMGRSFPVTIKFPIQNDPAGQVYSVELSVETGEADVYGRLEDAYPHGRMLTNAEPVEADAGFRLTYDYGARAVMVDMERVARGLWLILPLGLVLWAPGRLLLWRLLSRPGMDWGMRTALSIGMSLAVFPLVMLWTTALGLHWQRTAAMIAFGIVAALLAWRMWSGRWAMRRPDGLDLALMAVFVFTLALRLIMARDLAAPPWVDPVHHATITRLIVEQGQYPHTYAPFVETNGASYHPGFHATLAAFIWLSGMDGVDAMLLFGQVQNALMVLAVYLLAVLLTRDRLAGVLAALAAGVFLPMPAYYLSWGRYTQLAGLIILPACIYLIQNGLQNGPRTRQSRATLYLAAAAACAGMFLTHYRVAAFLALWLAAYTVAEVIRTLDRQAVWISLPKMAGHFAVVGAAAVLLTLPWWPELYASMLQPALERSGSAAPTALVLDWPYLNPVYGRQVMWIAALGLFFSITRLKWFGPTLVLWVGLLFMSANQGSIRLPLAGNVNKASVEITLFLPIAILAGYALTKMIKRWDWLLPRGLRWPFRAILTVGFVILALFGATRMLPLVNPGTLMARQADRPAWEWAAAHTAPDATFIINPFLWGYGIYAGQDGGYWLSPAAGRKTIPAISLYGLGPAERYKEINQISQAVLNKGKDQQALYDLMLANGIRYIYSGARGGTLSPKALSESPLFRVLYSKEGVWIFEAIGP